MGRIIKLDIKLHKEGLGSDVIYQGRGGKSDKIRYRDPYRGG